LAGSDPPGLGGAIAVALHSDDSLIWLWIGGYPEYDQPLQR